MTMPKINFDTGQSQVWRNVLRAMQLALLGAGVAGAALMSPAALAAQSCAFASVSTLSFGAYNVFDNALNTNGVGGLSITCKVGQRTVVVVTLSTGQSNTYTARQMNSGTNRLAYNLFTTTARTTIWGDGTGGSATLTASTNGSTDLIIFGQIPKGQDAAVGTYIDSIIATVNF